MSDKREFIEHGAALAMIADGDYVHTFRQGGFAIVGADWPRAELIAHVEAHKPELSGATATAMKHGLCIVDDRGPLWIETKDAVSAETTVAAAESEKLGGGE